MFEVWKGSRQLIRVVLPGIFLVLGAIWDIKQKKIPLVLLICFMVTGLLINILWPEHSARDIVCGVLIGIILYAVSYVTSGQIGEGDGILFMATGLFVGGMSNFVLLLWASVLCAVPAGIMLIAKKAGRKDRIPFVPFVFLAYVGQVIL